MAKKQFDFNSEPPGTDGNGTGIIDEPNSGSNGEATGFIDPASAVNGTSGDAGSGSGKRGRGRPKGSGIKGKTSQKGTPPLSINGVEKILFSVHTILAATLATPEIVLDEKEANLLASAVADVTAFYNIGMDPRTAAWVNLAMVGGSIYGPRAIAIYVRMSTREKRPTTHSEVVSEPRTNGFDTTKIVMPE